MAGKDTLNNSLIMQGLALSIEQCTDGKISHKPILRVRFRGELQTIVHQFKQYILWKSYATTHYYSHVILLYKQTDWTANGNILLTTVTVLIASNSIIFQNQRETLQCITLFVMVGNISLKMSMLSKLKTKLHDTTYLELTINMGYWCSYWRPRFVK